VIGLSVFEKPNKPVANKITQQAERLSRFIGADEWEIHFLNQPPPLSFTFAYCKGSAEQGELKRDGAESTSAPRGR
jgi:hypothetical protein